MESKYDQAIAAIYSASIDGSQWPTALDLCQRYVESKGSILLVTGVSATNEVMQLNFGSDVWRKVSDTDMEFYLKNLAHYDQPAYEHLSTLGKQDYLSGCEFYAGVENIRNRPDNVFFAEKVGIYHRMAVRLNDNKSWFDAGTFQFDKDQAKITDQQLRNILALTPHMAKSVEMARAWKLLHDRYAAVLGAMDKIQIGLAVVRQNGLVVEQNMEASRILDSFLAVKKSSAGYLQFSESGNQTNLLIGLRGATSGDSKDELIPESQISIRQNDAEYPLLIEITPLNDSLRELDGETGCALVLMIDTQNTRCISTRMLSTAWNLSAAEAEVCRHLVDGRTNASIAEIRGVSPDTIKSQISSVFLKTNCSNRAELIRLASKTSPPIETLQTETRKPSSAETIKSNFKESL